MSRNSLLSTCLLFLFAGVVASCTKEVDDPVYSLTPSLQVIDQSSLSLVEFRDTLYVELGYTDGDGDLGGFDGTSLLYVKDQRLQEADTYALQELLPANEVQSITGTLRVALGPFFVLSNANEETFVLEFWITDRSGNQSDAVVSAPITVRQS